jgi:hypothetical protein
MLILENKNGIKLWLFLRKNVDLTKMVWVHFTDKKFTDDPFSQSPISPTKNFPDGKFHRRRISPTENITNGKFHRQWKISPNGKLTRFLFFSNFSENLLFLNLPSVEVFCQFFVEMGFGEMDRRWNLPKPTKRYYPYHWLIFIKC